MKPANVDFIVILRQDTSSVIVEIFALLNLESCDLINVVYGARGWGTLENLCIV